MHLPANLLSVYPAWESLLAVRKSSDIYFKNDNILCLGLIWLDLCQACQELKNELLRHPVLKKLLSG